MLTAITINTFAVIFAWIARKRSPKWMIVSQLILTLFYGIRYDYGNDYWNYYEIFLKSSWGYDAELIEPGWWLINVLCQPIGFMGMIFFLTVFEYYAIYKHIKIYVSPKYWWIAVFIFTFTFNFQLLGCSMMRQFLSMTILLFAIKYIISRNILKFAFILALAFSIHKTAIVFLPVILFSFWIPKINRWKWIIVYTTIFCLLLAISVKYIEYFKIAAIMFDDEKFNRYLMGDEGSYSFTIIFEILWLILLMYTCPLDRAKSIICVVSLVSYILLPFTFVVVILLRLMLYFSLFFVFSIPNMFSSIRNHIIRYGLLSIYGFLLIKRSLTTLTGDTYGEFYDTYQSIFSAPSWL